MTTFVIELPGGVSPRDPEAAELIAKLKALKPKSKTLEEKIEAAIRGQDHYPTEAKISARIAREHIAEKLIAEAQRIGNGPCDQTLDLALGVIRGVK